ncbi:hypothetical protein GCM10023336_00390 [Streptomyces similanensis]|uniref:Uncharacterized protein n=1 Tax=Streptomyces similanensis TaxID=1274988 RepID=A0ABP9JRR5_9ACTN
MADSVSRTGSLVNWLDQIFRDRCYVRRGEAGGAVVRAYGGPATRVPCPVDV